MSWTHSSAPALYARLKEGLAERLAGKGHENDDVIISYGGLLDRSPWDHVVLGNVTDGVNTWTALGPGRKKRDETYDINIAIHCTRPGETAEQSMTDAYAHFHELEDFIAEAPCLGLQSVAPTLVVRVSEFSHEFVYDESSRGYNTTIDIKLAVSVRLS